MSWTYNMLAQMCLRKPLEQGLSRSQRSQGGGRELESKPSAVSLASTPRWFRCFIGKDAKREISERGLGPDAFRLVLAASGGPKWLGIVGLDRALRKYLGQRRQPISLLGASSGAWRMAAWSCDSSGDCFDELQAAYIGQSYEGAPTPDEVSEVCREYLGRVFNHERAAFSLSNSVFQANFTTAIFGLENPSKYRLMASLLPQILLNACKRDWLGLSFQRGLFSAGNFAPESPLRSGPWDGIPTRQIPLTLENYSQALLASGSIPFVLRGEAAIAEAGRGHHLDGGLLDYHFEVDSGGPIIYPNFTEELIPGWLDRYWPYRRLSSKAKAQLVLLVPTPEFIAQFPDRRLPCREDFHRLSNPERIRLWTAATEKNDLLQAELTACLEAGDLLKVAEDLH